MTISSEYICVPQPLDADRVGPGSDLEDEKRAQSIRIGGDDRGPVPEQHDRRPEHGSALVVTDAALDGHVLRGEGLQEQKGNAHDEQNSAG